MGQCRQLHCSGHFVLGYLPGSTACWVSRGPQPVCFPKVMVTAPTTGASDAAPPCRMFCIPLTGFIGSQRSPRAPQPLGAAAQAMLTHTGGQVIPWSCTPKVFLAEGRPRQAREPPSHSGSCSQVPPRLLFSRLNKPTSLSISPSHHVLQHALITPCARPLFLFLCALQDLFCGSYFLAAVLLKNATSAHAICGGIA